MAEKSTEPAASSTSALSTKPGKHFLGLRQLFTSSKSAKKVFPHDAFNKYEIWGANDYTIEGKQLSVPKYSNQGIPRVYFAPESLTTHETLVLFVNSLPWLC